MGPRFRADQETFAHQSLQLIVCMSTNLIHCREVHRSDRLIHFLFGKQRIEPFFVKTELIGAKNLVVM